MAGTPTRIDSDPNSPPDLHTYAGQWVVLHEGAVIEHGPVLKVIVDKARARGIRAATCALRRRTRSGRGETRALGCPTFPTEPHSIIYGIQRLAIRVTGCRESLHGCQCRTLWLRQLFLAASRNDGFFFSGTSCSIFSNLDMNDGFRRCCCRMSSARRFHSSTIPASS